MQAALRENASATQTRASSITKTDKEGHQVMFVNPFIPKVEQNYCKEMTEAEGTKIGNLDDDPITRGELFNDYQTKQFPSICRSFPWMSYTVAGIPDGILDTFVYEYKTTKKRLFFNFSKPVAFAQADLYGYFFSEQISEFK